MNYIYGYQNKINGKWYVGQTTIAPEERDRLHVSGANNPNTSDYNCLFHKKIREYGRNNFDFQILEEVPDKKQLDDREKYWIQEKHSFVQDNGYNLTTGGQIRKINENYIDVRQRFQTQNEIDIIIQEIRDNKISFSDLAKKYNISSSLICDINTGKKYYQDNLSYPLRPIKQKIDNDTVQQIIVLLEQNYSNQEIANLLQVDANSVYLINYGKAHRQKNRKYPIRQEKSKREQRADRIKQLLTEGKLNNKQIADLVNCDPSVVSNINYGKSYKDNQLNYPLRKS